MPVDRICLTCQAHFTVKLSHYRSGRGKYCSFQCRHPQRLLSLADRFWSYVVKTETCWLWQGAVTPGGYGSFHLTATRTITAHRCAWELTYGLILPGVLCCHHCDVRTCVRLDHLFLGAQSDNLRDMVNKGRHYAVAHPERLARGERHGAYTHPERLARGERHGAHTHPERLPRGEKNSSAKLTASQVRDIRQLHATGEWTQEQLAAHFAVSRHAIWSIIRGKTWTHIA
jgi:HNH endonuclease